MFFTHGFDLAGKLVATVIVVSAAVGVLVNIPDPGPAGFVAIFVGLVAATWALVWRPFLSPLTTMLWVWQAFDVRVGWREAARLAVLSQRDLLTSEWEGCDDVALIPSEGRRAALFARADAVRTERGSYLERSRLQSPVGRHLSPRAHAIWVGTMIAGVFGLAVGSFAQPWMDERLFVGVGLVVWVLVCTAGGVLWGWVTRDSH